MADIEVVFYDRIGPYRKGQIAIVPDNAFLRAIIKGGKADVINPPDWSPEKADAPVEPVKPAKVEVKKPEPIKEEADGSSDSESEGSEEDSIKLEDDRSGSSKKGEQRSEEDAATSSTRHRGPSKLPESGQEPSV